MMELIHNDIIVEIRICFRGKILRIESLNGDKQMVDAVSLVAAHKQLAEIGVFQHRPEGVQALLQNLLPMRHEQQPAGVTRMLFAETLVIQCGNHSLSGSGSSHYKVSVVPSHGTFCFQLIQNLLLVRIWQNVQRVDATVVGFAVLFIF